MKEKLGIRREFLRWFNLYNSKYSGGGGGVGRFTNPTTIYHQCSNGATNYHEMPNSVGKFYTEVLREMAPEIFKKVTEKINGAINEGKESEIKRLNKIIEELEEID